MGAFQPSGPIRKYRCDYSFPDTTGREIASQTLRVGLRRDFPRGRRGFSGLGGSLVVYFSRSGCLQITGVGAASGKHSAAHGWEGVMLRAPHSPPRFHTHPCDFRCLKGEIHASRCSPVQCITPHAYSTPTGASGGSRSSPRLCIKRYEEIALCGFEHLRGEGRAHLPLRGTRGTERR